MFRVELTQRAFIGETPRREDPVNFIEPGGPIVGYLERRFDDDRRHVVEPFPGPLQDFKSSAP